MSSALRRPPRRARAATLADDRADASPAERRHRRRHAAGLVPGQLPDPRLRAVRARPRRASATTARRGACTKVDKQTWRIERGRRARARRCATRSTATISPCARTTSTPTTRSCTARRRSCTRSRSAATPVEVDVARARRLGRCDRARPARRAAATLRAAIDRRALRSSDPRRPRRARFAVPAKVPVRARDLGRARARRHVRRGAPRDRPRRDRRRSRRAVRRGAVRARTRSSLMLAHDAYGGLEHRASSVNLFHPHFAGDPQGVRGPARAALARAVPRVERQADRAARRCSTSTTRARRTRRACG